MASAPQPTLPLFYQDLMPLNSRDHVKWRSRPTDSISWMTKEHAIPLTAEEFVQAQRDFPIVFSAGDNPVPLALMGLNEGVNTFIDEDGKPIGTFYLPAYARRYPFMLARLTPEAEELSLCFDPSLNLIGDFAEGEALFTEDGQPGAPVQAALQFCEQFEQAGARTQAFLEQLQKHDLLMDGEVAITQSANPDKPYVYRGFRMVNEEKLRALDPEVLKEWTGNGLLAILFAHLFFARPHEHRVRAPGQPGQDARANRRGRSGAGRLIGETPRPHDRTGLETRLPRPYLGDARFALPSWPDRVGALRCTSSLNLGHLVLAPGGFFLVALFGGERQPCAAHHRHFPGQRPHQSR